MRLHLLASALADAFAIRPAMAQEVASFELLDIIVLAASPCHMSALVSLPQGWSLGDGAVVLLLSEPMDDATRGGLVATLLAEQAAGRRRRLRLMQPMVRSTIQRFGSTTK